MIARNLRRIGRKKRQARIRRKVRGTPERPRLNVYCSGKHIYAQIIEDESGRTLAAASTLNKEIREGLAKTANKEAAKRVGEAIAQRALAKDIEQVVFDRNGYIYHGKVRALAEAAREKGLKF
ncbi:MAG: 50S ribosomal protein L18 [Deltaproteobacteria bacterium]|nr:MAG: 50S ribosomal protein L18 [Deltaproteobacteria bacterium]